MAYTETIQQLNDARRRIAEIRAEMRELQANIEPEGVTTSERSLWWNDAAPSVHAVGAAQSILLSVYPLIGNTGESLLLNR